jgi:hypothetical protein
MDQYLKGGRLDIYIASPTFKLYAANFDTGKNETIVTQRYPDHHKVQASSLYVMERSKFLENEELAKKQELLQNKIQRLAVKAERLSSKH